MQLNQSYVHQNKGANQMTLKIRRRRRIINNSVMMALKHKIERQREIYLWMMEYLNPNLLK